MEIRNPNIEIRDHEIHGARPKIQMGNAQNSPDRRVLAIGISYFRSGITYFVVADFHCHRSRRAPRGFTLLEVILALTILAGAMAVLGEVSRLALRNAAAARDLARAQLLAESKLAEIEAGITAPDPVENTPFDAATESLDPGEPAWLYSISQPSIENAEDGVISVRVTVTRDLPAGQHPVKFSLVRWLPDPNYTYTPPTPDSGASTSGGT